MVGPYLNNDKSTFAYVSATKRWPAIIDQAIGDLQNASTTSESAKSERSVLVERIQQIKQQLVENATISHLPASVNDAEVYNAEIDAAAEQSASRPLKWIDAPWLLSECLLYRQLQQVFDESQFWKSYDMFGTAKNSAFTKSSDAVSSLASRYVAIAEQLLAKPKDKKTHDTALELLFHELMSTSLWGNATDLSLLVTVSLDELKKLQVAADSRDKEMLLSNDYPLAWKQINTQVGGRVDIVLDNSGFELYTDLIFALFLLDSGLAEQIVFHPKNQPWFVSDVVPRDFGIVIAMLSNPTFFPQHREALDAIVEKLTNYMNDGSVVIRTSPFWTSPLPYWEIKENGRGGGHEVWKDFRASKLVFFKGDLNYRKLTGDLRWSRDTSFVTATQSLAHSNVPVVSLRTVKADVCVGLPTGKAEELAKKWKADHPDQSGEGWAWSGSYAVISTLNC